MTNQVLSCSLDEMGGQSLGDTSMVPALMMLLTIFCADRTLSR
ncbi:hypothetical protein CEV34_5562 [Brucella pseudogrignonensis]|uniref:Uncharacterized protein n=1 Tax=Brucella pseudogrignonensis TaxID=419475 RepID=A0A256G071_9HYPH|nr:hypothetical protein CEV34_5562 [Brucella pseudogrignonensis]